MVKTIETALVSKPLIREIVKGIEHHSNSLHFYCRLADSGIPESLALKIARAYEHTFYIPVRLLLELYNHLHFKN